MKILTATELVPKRRKVVCIEPSDLDWTLSIGPSARENLERLLLAAEVDGRKFDAIIVPKIASIYGVPVEYSENPGEGMDRPLNADCESPCTGPGGCGE